MITNQVSVSWNHEAEINTICICGAARSGTSMLSGILQLLNVDMGGCFIDDETNEDRRFLTHKGIRTIFEEKTTKELYLESLKPIITEHNHKALSGWKDPLSSYYISDISLDISNLGVIIVMRDPVSIALGEMRFRERLGLPVNNRTFLGALKFINNEYAAMSRFSATFPGRLLILSYEKALLHKNILIDDLTAFTGIDINIATRDNLVSYITPEAVNATIGKHVSAA